MAGKSEIGLAGDDLAYAGWLCPGCKYDLRGLREAVCPECGTEFECRPKQPRAWRPIVGTTATVIAISLACITIMISIQSCESYVSEIGAGCGTGRLAAKMTLMSEAPVAAGFVVLMWVVTRKVGFARSWSRLAAIASMTAWLASLGIVFAL